MEMKEFNVAGTCLPEEHYMADITEKINQIMQLIKKGKYFTINRVRQYGKTTTLRLLERRLSGEYLVFSISFEGVGLKMFSAETEFVKKFQEIIKNELEFQNQPIELIQAWESSKKDPDFFDLSRQITLLCQKSEKKIVLLIDEVDKSSDNQIFLSFLGVLRNKYLERDRRPTFQSVVLAGVYDIRNRKPLNNGMGFYEVETQTSDETRMDVVLIYGRSRYIIELKLWYGEKRHEEAYQQLTGYLKAKNEEKGYLLTFDFWTKRETGYRWMEIEGKRIFDIIV